VEVSSVLDPAEKSVFDGLVSQLRGDSKFAHKIDKLGSPRRRFRTALAVLLWTMAPIAMIVGGWTGFFMAVVGICYGIHLVMRKPGLEGGQGFPWRSSPGPRPGASI
jgi:hypothetical protein